MPEENAELSSALRSLEIELSRRNELDICTEQLKDGDLKKIIDVLYRYSQDNDDHERTRVLKQYHDSPTAGHYGIERTHHRIQQRYYWPGMRRYIADYLKTCHECQRYKPHNLKPAGLLQTLVLQQRMEVIDLFGPLPPASTGERWILIIQDYATRWIELFALVDATADCCVWTFVNEV
jgi:hypothetical protein